MSLHNEIMNLPQTPEKESWRFASILSIYTQSYKIGHRDARHAAAELALKYERALEYAIEVLGDVAKCGSEGDASYCEASLITINDILGEK